ncbi:MAG: hypothetical protein ACJ8DJ_03010, partial [Gemmatimonadales bacterium]
RGHGRWRAATSVQRRRSGMDRESGRVGEVQGLAEEWAAAELRGDTGWRGWGRYSLIASLATVVLIAITFHTFSPSTPPTARLGGLMERVLFIEILAWYVAFGWRLFRTSRASSERELE